jgi:broad specificity polyphosphatase/5'/3'-nucleotidase SurE
MLAVEALMPERPNFVLSGINHGQNMGEDVLYSGTVAAAMEGLSLGIPSVAISFAGGDLRADVSMLSDQVEPLRNLLEHVISLPSFPANTLLNISLDWGGVYTRILSSQCRTRGDGRFTGSAVDRSRGRARRRRIFGRYRKAIYRSRHCTWI